MYKTDNGRWMVLANGFTCMLYFRTPEDPPRYAEVYRDVVIAVGENVPNIDEAAKADYTRFLAGLAKPFAEMAKRPRIVMRSPFWRNVTKAECTEKAAGEVGAVYVDAGGLGDSDENKAKGLFAHQGVANHPGDLGMRRLADLILGAFDAGGKSSR